MPIKTNSREKLKVFLFFIAEIENAFTIEPITILTTMYQLNHFSIMFVRIQNLYHHRPSLL
jgi:hypothetical protein